MTVLDEILVRLGVDMSDAEGEVERGADGITGRLDGLAAAGGVAAAGLGAMFVTGLEAAMDISSVQTRLADQLGLTEEEAARAGRISGEVFSAGWGESIGAVGDALGAVVSSFGELGDFTDAEFEEMSKSALRLADRLQVDVGDSAKAAGQLVKQGLADNATEAFDVLTVAARQFPEAMRGDIPEVVAEYGKHLKQIGLDAQTSFGMMSQFVQAGGRDIDQAGDVLHEFARITSEESARAADGFKALGLNADTMLSDIHEGGKPAADALALTLDALRGVKDPAKQAELGVALFGDMAGEATTALLAMNPATATAGNELGNVSGAAAAANAAMEASPAQQWDSVMRTLTTTLGQTLLPVLNAVAGFMKEHPGAVQVLVPVVLALAAALAVAAAAQWALNSAFLANPLTWIVIAVVAVVAAIVVLWKKSETFRNFWIGAWRAISGAITTVWNWIKGNWPLLLAILTGPIGLAVLVITRHGNSIVNFFRAMPGRISSAARGMWNGITSSFRNAVNAIIGGWNRLSFTIGGGSIMGISIPSLTLSTPNIPFLAKGGITTGPTLAMIGEGREDEAVLPLSRLEQLINQPTSAASTRRIQPLEARFTLLFEGADDAFVAFLQQITRTKGGGSIVQLAEG
ncbi:hypothetical protein DF268_36040 [Streptomyces sp. V2]|uniref:phage tail tape measure protein n=1 Tax=Streptomyces sp. V2 TaxID=1424099 RepID=UPI000D66A2EB|nr:phage tail tape measure protein [Streptomyces sp. V2]PWG08783.1 hypothetical protein DF268_36040 [Streptomyces sp. V2]